MLFSYINLIKERIGKMIENKNEVSKDLEKALQALEQAKQRVANEKKSRMRRNVKPRTTTSTSWAALS